MRKSKENTRTSASDIKDERRGGLIGGFHQRYKIMEGNGFDSHLGALRMFF